MMKFCRALEMQFFSFYSFIFFLFYFFFEASQALISGGEKKRFLKRQLLASSQLHSPLEEKLKKNQSCFFSTFFKQKNHELNGTTQIICLAELGYGSCHVIFV
jgi:hypothetical protein